MMVRGRLYTGDLDGAARLAQEHIQACEALAASQPANIALRRLLMNSYVEMAYVHSYPGFLSYEDADGAAAFHQKALVLARELAAKDPKNATAQFDLAITEGDLCDVLNRRHPGQAIGYCRDAMAIAERWPEQFIPDGVLASLGESLRMLGRRAESLEVAQRSMRVRIATVERDPTHFLRRQALLRSRNQMAGLLLEMDDRGRALTEYRQALAMAEQMASDHPANLVARRDLADTYEGLGSYYEREDRRQAREWYQKSLDIWTAWPGSAPTTRMDQAHREKAAQTVARLAR
jgi:hypothetical protein